MTSLKAACIQLCATPDIDENLRQAKDFIKQAAVEGATFIATPENTCRMRATKEQKLESSCEEKDHPAIPFFSKLSKDLVVWLLIGSLSSVRLTSGKLANRSYLFNPDGDIAAKYDKIHLFDVDLPNGDCYRESDSCAGGEKAVLVDTDFATLGLTICYDLRFPHLFRHLAKEGAHIITVPSAFTVPTGRAHWETLLRARAIETGCFIIAPAQCGEHEGGRGTWGHSLIISPWGEILGEAGEAPGYITVDLDLDRVAKARGAVPSLRHDRDYS